MHADYIFYHKEIDEEFEDGEARSSYKEEKVIDPITEKMKKLPCGHTYLDHVWYDKPSKPAILEAGKISDKIYFIVQGPIYLMDSQCLFEYGVLEDGSYFGDISLFFNEPN